MLRLCLCFLLLCASATVLARDLRLQTANGEEGACPSAEAETHGDAKSPAARAAVPDSKARKPASVRGSDNPRSQGPRWHSFLPGMFR